MRRQMRQILCGCVGALLLGAHCAGQMSAFGPTEPFLIYGHDGPNPGIWKVKFTSSPHTATKLLGVNEGLTGVWGLTTGDGKIWWTHKQQDGPDAGETVLFTWDGNTSYQFGKLPIRHYLTNDPVEISGLAYYDGLLVGTGPSDGWSEFASDGTTYYVSSSEGDDENDGLSEQTPFETLWRARDELTGGQADRLLLKRGDTWYDNEESQYAILFWDRGGADADRPMVIGSYGTHADRPKIVSRMTNGLARTVKDAVRLTGSHSNLVIRDLHIVQQNGDRRPAVGISISGSWSNVLIENCLVEGFYQNIVVNSGPSNVGIRRCIIADAYSAYGPGSTWTGNAVGIYANDVDGLLIEECIFDYNGWSDTRTMTYEAAGGGIDWIKPADGIFNRYGRMPQPAGGALMGITLQTTINGQQYSGTISQSYGNEGLHLGGSAGAGYYIRFEEGSHTDPNVYVGSMITIMLDTGTTDIPREIVAYDDQTRIATVDSAFFGNASFVVPNHTRYFIDGPDVPRIEVSPSLPAAPGPRTSFGITGFFANIFRHNMYIDSRATNVVVRGNISARPSSQGIMLRPGGVIDSNLCLNSPISMSIANSDPLVQPGGTVRNNAIVGARNIWHPTSPHQHSFGMWFNGDKDLDIYGNIIAHQGRMAAPTASKRSSSIRMGPSILRTCVCFATSPTTGSD